MAPNSETGGLRTRSRWALPEAILVSDPALKGTDALGTAKGARRGDPRTPVRPR